MSCDYPEAGAPVKAGVFGSSGAGLRAADQKVALGPEREVWIATLDARAWEGTWLPARRQSILRRSRLARRGVALPQTNKRLDRGSERRTKQSEEHPQTVAAATPTAEG